MDLTGYRQSATTDPSPVCGTCSLDMAHLSLCIHIVFPWHAPDPRVTHSSTTHLITTRVARPGVRCVRHRASGTWPGHDARSVSSLSLSLRTADPGVSRAGWRNVRWDTASHRVPPCHASVPLVVSVLRSGPAVRTSPSGRERGPQALARATWAIADLPAGAATADDARAASVPQRAGCMPFFLGSYAHALSAGA